MAWNAGKMIIVLLIKFGIWEIKIGLGDIAQCVKRLLSKHADPSLDSHHGHKIWALWHIFETLVLGVRNRDGQILEFHWLVNLPKWQPLFSVTNKRSSLKIKTNITNQWGEQKGKRSDVDFWLPHAHSQLNTVPYI